DSSATRVRATWAEVVPESSPESIPQDNERSGPSVRRNRATDPQRLVDGTPLFRRCVGWRDARHACRQGIQPLLHIASRLWGSEEKNCGKYPPGGLEAHRIRACGQQRRECPVSPRSSTEAFSEVPRDRLLAPHRTSSARWCRFLVRLTRGLLETDRRNLLR